MSTTSKKDTDSASSASANPTDLTAFVQTLLDQMQTRFSQMSDQIITKIDDMGARVDELEKSISVLMDQTSVEGFEVDMDMESQTGGKLKGNMNLEGNDNLKEEGEVEEGEGVKNN